MSLPGRESYLHGGIFQELERKAAELQRKEQEMRSQSYDGRFSTDGQAKALKQIQNEVGAFMVQVVRASEVFLHRHLSPMWSLWVQVELMLMVASSSAISEKVS